MCIDIYEFVFVREIFSFWFILLGYILRNLLEKSIETYHKFLKIH